MNAKHFARYVGQFGLPCIERLHYRHLKNFIIFWCALSFTMSICTFYHLSIQQMVWVWYGLDAFACVAFVISAWQRYQLHCFIHAYRQKHPDVHSTRTFTHF